MWISVRDLEDLYTNMDSFLGHCSADRHLQPDRSKTLNLMFKALFLSGCKSRVGASHIQYKSQVI